MSDKDLTTKVLEECAADRFRAMEVFLQVQNKQGVLVPAKPTKFHRDYEKYALEFSVVLKPRKVYFTTYKIGSAYLRCVEEKGKNCVFVNIDGAKTEEVFRTAHAFHEHIPRLIKPTLKVKQSRKMVFAENNTSFNAISCGNDIGAMSARSLGISIMSHDNHISEAAYMIHLQAFLEGLLGSMPKDGSGRVCLESTGNGAQGYYYELAMEIIENGVEVAPNHFQYAGKSFHFQAWFQHYENFRDEDPLKYVVLQPIAKIKLLESEEEHLAEMAKYDDMDGKDKLRAIYWRRNILINDYNLNKDPDGAIKKCNQEYPANWRHGFQSTGGAYLSLIRIDQMRDKWKKFNTEGPNAPLPIVGRLIHERGKTPEFTHGNDVMVWFPPERGWTNRYCIGADIGGGLADSDRDCAFVKDRVRNIYVACIHGTYGAKKMAQLCLMLAAWYDMAKLGWENNYFGIGVTIEVRRSDYPNVYKHREGDNDLDFGFSTTGDSRELGLQHFKDRFDDMIDGIEIPYLQFYKEAAAFKASGVRHKPQGVGERDDTVMGAMITEAVSASMAPATQVARRPDYAPGTLGHRKYQDMVKEKRTHKALTNW